MVVLMCCDSSAFHRDPLVGTSGWCFGSNGHPFETAGFSGSEHTVYGYYPAPVRVIPFLSQIIPVGIWLAIESRRTFLWKSMEVIVADIVFVVSRTELKQYLYLK